jgi:amino acid adenylation domain-containing protein
MTPTDNRMRAKPFHPTGLALEDKREEIDQTLPERFEKIVRQYPDRLALKSANRSLTYDELNRFANRIARSIMAMRGPASEPICLFFDSGIDGIAAILGALKAGKYFVTLDASFPASRIRFMIEDAQAGLIVTNDTGVDSAREFSNGKLSVLNVDEISDRVGEENLGLSLSPKDFATILYTSGSTGEPKGVLQDHAVNMHHALLDDMRFEDRISLLHSVAFGSGRADVFFALLNGATLLPFDLKSEGVHRLARWLQEERITVCHLPPAAFRKLAEFYGEMEAPASLRLLRLSGAPVTRVEFELYRKTFPSGTSLQINMGSAEAKRICGAVVDSNFSFPEEGVPVGYAAPWKKVSLVDETGREVGPGEAGEIAVKSRYLSIGYWRRPELTRAKFLRDRDGGDEPTYLTGDLGRMLADGFLIHLGRKDLMVKIRGYRVELGEIERVLLEHPKLKEAGVTAWNRESGETHLAAYIVAEKNSRPTVDDLRGFLREKLPDYMIPSAFMFMDYLPLLNGKLDRKALPQPDGMRPALQQTYVPARNETEKELVRIWETVLDIHPVGVDDNFFDLGGHSLSATRVVSQVIKQFQLEIPLQSLFQSPTVAAMAVVITESQTKEIGEKDLLSILNRLESLSEEEARELLAEGVLPDAKK